MASFDKLAATITKLRTPGSSKGVSRSAIKAAIPEATPARLNAALKKAIAAGKIIQVKDSFKVRVSSTGTLFVRTPRLGHACMYPHSTLLHVNMFTRSK